MLNLSYFLGLASKHDANDLAPALRQLSRKEQLEVTWKLSPPECLVELQLTQEKLDHWVDIAGSLIECGKDYNPSGSVCESHVVGIEDRFSHIASSLCSGSRCILRNPSSGKQV